MTNELLEKIYEPSSLSSLMLSACKVHARTVKDNYAVRRQKDKIKKIQDRYIGKCSEWKVYNSFLPLFSNITEPDMRVLKVEEKSWEPDLYIGKLPVIVKSCSPITRRKYCLSWMFSASKKKGKGKDIEVFGDDVKDKLCAFVLGDTVNNVFQIRVLVPLYTLLKEDLFSSPKVFHLQEYKKSVYACDLSIKGYRYNEINDSVYKLFNSYGEKL